MDDDTYLLGFHDSIAQFMKVPNNIMKLIFSIFWDFPYIA